MLTPRSSSWNAVGLAAVGGGVGGSGFGNGVAENLGFKTAGFAQSAIAGAANSILTQGIGVATGLQKNFSWAGVAAAGVSAGVLSQFNLTSLSETQSLGNIAAHVGASTAAAIANAATRSLIEGTDFGDNLRAALPDVIGSTIGEAIAGEITRGLGSRHAEPSEFEAGGPVLGGASQSALGADPRLVRIQLGDASDERLELSDEDIQEIQRLLEEAEGDRIRAAIIKSQVEGDSFYQNARNIQQVFTALGWDGAAETVGLVAASREGMLTAGNEFILDMGNAIKEGAKLLVGPFGDQWRPTTFDLVPSDLADLDPRLKALTHGRTIGETLDGVTKAFNNEMKTINTLVATDPEGAAKEISRLTTRVGLEVGSVFVPVGGAAKAGLIEDAARLAGRGGSLLKSNTALSGEVARIVFSNGANKLTEAKGLLFAAKEAKALGYDFTASLVYNKSGHGIDAVFRNAGSGRYAIWEARGGTYAVDPKSLRADRFGIVTMSERFASTRLARALRANPEGPQAKLIQTLQGELRAGHLGRFASFRGSKSTYEGLAGPNPYKFYPNGPL